MCVCVFKPLPNYLSVNIFSIETLINTKHIYFQHNTDANKVKRSESDSKLTLVSNFKYKTPNMGYQVQSLFFTENTSRQHILMITYNSHLYSSSFHWFKFVAFSSLIQIVIEERRVSLFKKRNNFPFILTQLPNLYCLFTKTINII